MNQRQALQLALEFCEFLWQDVAMNSYAEEYRNRVEVALRAVLIKPEPRNQCGETCERAKLCAVCARGLVEPQEPVTWRYWSTKWHSWEYSDAPPVFPAVPAGTKVEPLYTHPPQRQPLSDEEIMDLVRDMSIQMRWPSTPLDIARAIERAHEIGVQDE